MIPSGWAPKTDFISMIFSGGHRRPTLHVVSGGHPEQTLHNMIPSGWHPEHTLHNMIFQWLAPRTDFIQYDTKRLAPQKGFTL